MERLLTDNVILLLMHSAEWRHLTGYCTNSISIAIFLDLGVAKICLPHLGHYQHSAEQSFDVKHTLPKVFLGCKNVKNIWHIDLLI